ncbi:MAG: transposase [Bdellovibrionales bacterium]|nr:transposase [Bdellovibrionales bacterium]
MHLVLKSERATGALSMWNPKNKAAIQKIVCKHAEFCDVRIYRFSNNGNHIHLALRAKERRQFQKFLRSISGLVARHVLNAKKGRPALFEERNNKSKARKFWTSLAFTRVTEWGQAFTNLSNYVIQNILESAGVIPHQPRKGKRKLRPPEPTFS